GRGGRLAAAAAGGRARRLVRPAPEPADPCSAITGPTTSGPATPGPATPGPAAPGSATPGPGGIMTLLQDRVVLISGGTGGLGAGIARAAAREGALVAVTGRRREPGEALVAELTAAGAKALYVQADVGDVAQAQAAAAATITELGRVDSLVNAAGLT